MKKPLWSALTLGVSILLASCGGSSNPTATPTATTANATTPTIKATIAVPGSATPPFSFDISYADSGKYFLADRNNAAVDVVDTKSNTLIGQIKGTGASAFTGFNSNSDIAGPDGLVGIPGTNTLYAGDVNSIKVIDISTQQVVSTIAVPPLNTAPHRVDEGCYDPDDNLVMFSSPSETPPTATFISTKTNSIVATYQFTTSHGLEACVYDSKSKSFLVNNDATPSNPAGEVNVIAASTVVANAPVVSKVFPLGACGPTGLELGPNNDMLVGCDSAAGNPLITLILDRTTGATLASIPFGGVDQVAYDAVSNRYFLPARHETASGVAASSGFTPTLGIIDASTRKLIDTLAMGTGVHSVAVDGASGQAYVPFQPGAAAFPNGGILVVTTH